MEKMKRFINKKKEATGAVAYVCLFLITLLLVMLSLYMGQVAKLMTHSHHVDDALTDSVLASLVADDVYYFRTYETTGSAVIRMRNVNESYATFKDCMEAAVSDTTDFYYNFALDDYIIYEVEGNQITITEYAGASGNKTVRRGTLGSVRCPTGEVVRETSAYGKVRFDIKSIIDGSFINKTKDIYCTLEINQ